MIKRKEGIDPVSSFPDRLSEDSLVNAAKAEGREPVRQFLPALKDTSIDR